AWALLDIAAFAACAALAARGGGLGAGSARRPKPRRDATDGQEQRREIALLRRLARGRAVAPQQLDLLAVHLVEGRQATPEPLAKPGEPLGEVAAPRHAAHDLDRAVVLLLEQGENVLARPRVGNEPGVLADQPEIDVGEGLLHLVDDQTEQAEVGEHPLEERLAPGAADLQKRRDPAPDPVPARHEVTVLRPREYPRDGPQVGERAPPEPPRRPRADGAQPQPLERTR